MEGKKHTQRLNRSHYISSGFVLLFHAVGFYGFSNPERAEEFLPLVPMHLLLMLLLMLISQQERNRDFFLFVSITYLAGYAVEFLGVHSGMIFGAYQYGPTLGIKLAEIPLLIGVNWVLLIYSAGLFIHSLGWENLWIKSAAGAVLLVCLDILIEPVAIRFNYWNWTQGIIPLQNYIAWLLVSFAGCFLFNRLQFNKVNPSAIVLLIAQFLFFIGLNVIG